MKRRIKKIGKLYAIKAEDPALYTIVDKINELIDTINEMSEGCEHEWVGQISGNDSFLSCAKCGAVENTPEDKQEDEEEVSMSKRNQDIVEEFEQTFVKGVRKDPRGRLAELEKIKFWLHTILTEKDNQIAEAKRKEKERILKIADQVIEYCDKDSHRAQGAKWGVSMLIGEANLEEDKQSDSPFESVREMWCDECVKPISDCTCPHQDYQS